MDDAAETGRKTRRAPAGNGRKAIVAALRANGASKRGAAQQSGVGERTIHRWEGENDAEYWQYWRESIAHIRNDAYAEGILVVRTLMRSAESESVRLGAARTIITSVDGDAPMRIEHGGRDGAALTLDMILRTPAVRVDPLDDEDADAID